MKVSVGIATSRTQSVTLYTTAVVLAFISALFFASPAFAQSATQVSTGYNSACAVVNYKAKCWGSGAYGKLGNKSTSGSTRPVNVYAKAAWTETIPAHRECTFIFCNDVPEKKVQRGATAMGGKSVSKVSVGKNHTCAIANASAYCWGKNDKGQLGNGKNGWLQQETEPVAVLATGNSALKNKEVVDISAGDDFTCALASDGEVACWGKNDNGQLGISNRDGKRYPVAVSKATNTTSVRDDVCLSAGYFGSCNEYQYTQIKPSALVDKRVKKLATLKGKTATMCAITTEDKAVCWGRNDFGQAGFDNGQQSAYVVASGYGHNTDSNRCTQAKREAERDAEGDIREKIQLGSRDVLRPHLVNTNQRFSDIRIVTSGGITQSLSEVESGTTMTYSYTTGITATSSLPSQRAFYWGGSAVFDVRRKCKENHDYGNNTNGSANEWTKYYIDVDIELLTRNIPTGPLYKSAAANQLRDSKIRLNSGNAYIGSNIDEYPVCVTETISTGWWGSQRQTVTACNESPPGMSCATVAAGQNDRVYCDRAYKVCNTTGSALGDAWLQATGQWHCRVQSLNGPQLAQTGGSSWLKPDMYMVDIDTGFSGFTCAIAQNGTIGCWGENGSGQLGIGSTTDKMVPTKVEV